MSLESCPTCGYALSTLGNHCRHCASSFSEASSFGPLNAKYLPQIITATVVFIAFAYLIFFR
jgi:predicted amidophosphoribosyltransferase